MRNSTTYKLAGPKTFRRSSTKILQRWGGNMQNYEKSIRKIYEPDGYQKELDEKCLHWLKTGELHQFNQEELDTLRAFVQTDQAGAEALIVAYECEAGDYRQLFIHGVKPHVYVAMKLFRDIWTKKMKEHGGLIEDFDIDILCATPIAKLKQNPSWRDLDLLIKSSDNWNLTERYYYLAKQTVHSSNYGIRWSNFIMNVLEKSGGKIVLSRKQGEYFLETYHSLFPEIEERNRRIGKQVEQTKMLYNIFGFPYTVTDYNILDTKLKEFYAWSAQSSVGEITRIAVSRMQEYIEDKSLRWDFMVDCHDSMLHQCPIYEVQSCIAKQKETMNQKLISPVDSTVFFMKSECNCGMNWGQFDKSNPEKNPLGLRELEWN